MGDDPSVDICKIKRGPRPWEERKPKETPRDKDISKKPPKDVKSPRIPGNDQCAELEKIVGDKTKLKDERGVAFLVWIITCLNQSTP